VKTEQQNWEKEKEKRQKSAAAEYINLLKEEETHICQPL
jgi:hypothetical protein